MWLLWAVWLVRGASGYFRIVGGEEARIENFPYVVSLHHTDGRFICGGSLLSRSWILTAAHCLELAGRIPLPTRSFWVIAGTADVTGVDSTFWDLFSERQKRTPERFVVHPDYDQELLENDIAVLRVSRPFTISLTMVAPVRLPAGGEPSEDPLVGQMCTVIGWGILEDYDSERHEVPKSSQQLHQVSLKVISANMCQRMYTWRAIDRRSLLCTLTDDKDACQGDSGGPLVCDGVQQGIVSWGQGCAKRNHPGVFTRTGHYMDWIRSTAGAARASAGVAAVLATLSLYCWQFLEMR